MEENKEQKNSSSLDEKFHLLNFLKSLRFLVRSTLTVDDNAHPSETIDSIQKDVVFKGYNVWILIFSILIASIGLNVNSAAVVIGAMLISPLMGPILGVGMSVGINDWLGLKKSLKNFGIMLFVSMATSTFYFAITPLDGAQSELLARTSPTLLDVFIAFFGGIAGILAANRKIKNNVVPGVAIATALMPPLCTAGFALANGEWSFFLGAFYLFLINSIFISLATFSVVRVLKFPVMEFLDPKKEKKARNYIFIFVLLIVIPSGFIFYNVVKKSLFNNRAESFISQTIQFNGSEIVKKDLVYDADLSRISIVMFGEPVPEELIEDWRKKLSIYDLGNCELKIIQAKNFGDSESEEVNKLLDVFTKSQNELDNQYQVISSLEEELARRSSNQVEVIKLARELRIIYDQIEQFGYSQMLLTNFKRTDTLNLVHLYWKQGVAPSAFEIEQNKVKEILKMRLNSENVEILNLPYSFEKDSSAVIDSTSMVQHIK